MKRCKSGWIDSVSLSHLGLELNTLKCCVLFICSDKRKFSFVDIDVSISVKGTRLSVVTAESEFQYLGIQFNWKGVDRTPLDLKKLLLHLNCAALKPQQKLIILRRFLLPCLQHQLTFGQLHNGEYVKGDKAIRRAIRRWLWLPVDCKIWLFVGKHHPGYAKVVAPLISIVNVVAMLS